MGFFHSAKLHCILLNYIMPNYVTENQYYTVVMQMAFLFIISLFKEIIAYFFRFSTPNEAATF